MTKKATFLAFCKSLTGSGLRLLSREGYLLGLWWRPSQNRYGHFVSLWCEPDWDRESSELGVSQGLADAGLGRTGLIPGQKEEQDMVLADLGSAWMGHGQV